MKSPLHWDKKFTKRDLIQLITILHETQCIVDSDMQPASLSSIAEHFSLLLNEDLNYIYKEKSNLSNRYRNGRLLTAIKKKL